MATQRTTKKKAAKKTFTPAQKTSVPKLKKKWTVEELAAVMAENHAKTEAAIQELSAENRKTSAEVAANHAKTEKILQETLRSVEKMSKKVDDLSDNVGNVNNRLGRMVELVIAPKIRYDINTAGGHNFSHVEANVKAY